MGGMGQMGGHHAMGTNFGGGQQRRSKNHMGVGQMAAMKAMHKVHHPQGGRPNMHPRMALMNLDFDQDLMELKHKHHHHHHHHKTEEEETPKKKQGKCTVERSQDPHDWECFCHPGDQWLKPHCKINLAAITTPPVCTKARVLDPMDLECACYPGDEFNVMKPQCADLGQW